MRNDIELSRPQQDGRPLRHHLAAVERATRRPQKRLHIRPPAAAQYLLAIFSEILDGRPPVTRANPLTLHDLVEWSSATGLQLTLWERTTLLRLGSAYTS